MYLRVDARLYEGVAAQELLEVRLVLRRDADAHAGAGAAVVEVDEAPVPEHAGQGLLLVADVVLLRQYLVLAHEHCLHEGHHAGPLPDAMVLVQQLPLAHELNLVVPCALHLAPGHPLLQPVALHLLR